MKEHLNYRYSKKEELLNIISHGLGLILSLIAFPYIVFKALYYPDVLQTISLIIYGFSLIVLYTASTFYHATEQPLLRRQLNIIDHAAIYVLIAGSYSPFCIVVLNNKLGFYLFLFVWIFALIGIILKLFFTGRFRKLSTAMYLFMGWQVVFFIKPLIQRLSTEGVYYLIAGGIFYTIGALFYALDKKVKYNHAIFHVFVLLGSLSHFLAIYNL